MLHLTRKNQLHRYRIANNWIVTFLLKSPWDDRLNHKLSMSQHYHATVKKKTNNTLGFLSRSRAYRLC